MTAISPYYKDEYVTLYCAECEELLPELEHHDLLLTDPPYGNGSAYDHSDEARRLRAKKGFKEYLEVNWDNEPISDDLLKACIDKADKQIIFGGNYYKLPPSRCWLVWDKESTAYFADAELAWTNLEGAVRLKRYLWNGCMKEHPEMRFHPTQKPLAIMSWCLEHAGAEVRSVLDPFTGSGTTLVAAKLRNLKATGIEREEQYCEIAAKRLEQGVLALG
jgi:DNA modification methylase